GQLDQLTGEAGETLRAALGHEHVVLDADAAETGDVDAGLDGEGDAGDEGDVLVGGDVGLLVNVEAEAVAGAVEELRAQAGGLDDGAGGAVDLGAGDAGAGGLAAGGVGVPDGLVDG